MTRARARSRVRRCSSRTPNGKVVPVHRRVRRPRLHPVRDHRPRTPAWTVAAELRPAAQPRHGTVLPVTRAEYDRLTRRPAAGRRQRGRRDPALRLHGCRRHGRAPTARATATTARSSAAPPGSGDALTFDGTDDYVDLPDHLLTGVDDVTRRSRGEDRPLAVGLVLHLRPRQHRRSRCRQRLPVHDRQQRLPHRHRDRATGRRSRTSNSGSALPRGKWKHLTYTLEGDDRPAVPRRRRGRQEHGRDARPRRHRRRAAPSPTTSAARSTTPTRASAASSASSRSTTGRCSPSEVLTRSGNTASARRRDARRPRALKVAPIVDADRTHRRPPGRSGHRCHGARRRSSTPPTGVTASPASGTPVDLSEPVHVHAHGARRRDGDVDDAGARDEQPCTAGPVRRPEHRGVRRHVLHLRDHRRLRRLGRQGVLRLEVEGPRRLGALGRALPDARRRERRRALGDRERVGADRSSSATASTTSTSAATTRPSTARRSASRSPTAPRVRSSRSRRR